MPIHRGEIYFVNLNPVAGREQAGQRPVLILSTDAINRLPLVVTVVVGTKGENIARDYPTNVRITREESGLPMETVFLCFQIRSLDPSRFPPVPAESGGHTYTLHMSSRSSALMFLLCQECRCDPITL